MKRYRTFYVVLFLVVLVCLLLGLIQLLGVVWILPSGDDVYWEQVQLKSFPSGLSRSLVLPVISPPARESQHNCTYHTCFDVYRCGYTSVDGPPQISVYVYPPARYVDEDRTPHEVPMSQEFASILRAIVDSGFYTSDASTACLLVPSIDLLNQDTVRLHLTAQILASLHRYTYIICVNNRRSRSRNILHQSSSIGFLVKAVRNRPELSGCRSGRSRFESFKDRPDTISSPRS